MDHQEIVRAWKDAAYRKSLSAAQLAELPAHPAQGVELSDDEQRSVVGGLTGWPNLFSIGCCWLK